MSRTSAILKASDQIMAIIENLEKEIGEPIETIEFEIIDIDNTVNPGPDYMRILQLIPQSDAYKKSLD